MEVGSIVKSLSGRDKKNYYIVKEINDNFVSLIDGKAKTINNVKMKNIKHVFDCDFVDCIIKDKLVNKKHILDAEIRKSLKLFKNSEEK